MAERISRLPSGRVSRITDGRANNSAGFLDIGFMDDVSRMSWFCATRKSGNASNTGLAAQDREAGDAATHDMPT
jgi:hypothetical protein